MWQVDEINLITKYVYVSLEYVHDPLEYVYVSLEYVHDPLEYVYRPPEYVYEVRAHVCLPREYVYRVREHVWPPAAGVRAVAAPWRGCGGWGASLRARRVAARGGVRLRPAGSGRGGMGGVSPVRGARGATRPTYDPAPWERTPVSGRTARRRHEVRQASCGDG